jgi:hypothetical protein
MAAKAGRGKAQDTDGNQSAAETSLTQTVEKRTLAPTVGGNADFSWRKQ